MASVLVAPFSVGLAQGNIVVIVADDLGSDNVCRFRGLGENCVAGVADVPNTPRMDGMMDLGVRFDTAWSNPVCSTTRATLQTGQFSRRTGVGGTVAFDGEDGLQTESWTFAEMLKDAATLCPLAASCPDIDIEEYSIAAFGKWHLNSTEEFREGEGAPIDIGGFDYYEGTEANLNRSPGVDYCDYRWVTFEEGVPAQPPVQTMEYVTRQTTTRALNWIDDHRNDPEPWLVYIAYHAPHTPLHLVTNNGTFPDPDTNIDRTVFDCGVPCAPGAGDSCATEMIEALDSEIGYFVDVLAAGLTAAEFPTILFVSDNGSDEDVIDPIFNPVMGEDHSKGTVFEGGMRVPFFAAGGVVSAAGAVVDDFVGTTDLFHTIAELAGISDFDQLLAIAPPGVTAIDSVSLVPYFSPNGDCNGPCRENLFTELFDGPTADSMAIRTTSFDLEEFKLIRDCVVPVNCPDGGCLYDVESDPHEENPLSFSTVKDILSAELDAHLLSFDNVCAFAEIDPTCDWCADANEDFCLTPCGASNQAGRQVERHRALGSILAVVRNGVRYLLPAELPP